jgi:penicillin-binding protein 2
MSFHPNDVARRGRQASVLLLIVIGFLLSAFFRTQILRNQQWLLQSEENRLREVPLPAARGIIYDRAGKIIAENAVGYAVSLLPKSEDSLRATLQRLKGTIELTPNQIDAAIKRYRRDRARPAVIIPDASFDVVSVLEEHRIDFPSLIIQSAPKRYYPDSGAVAAFVGYTGEINESELASPQYQGYKAGQQIGKQGLEKQYEAELRGREGSRFVEVDARNSVLREVTDRQLDPVGAQPLYTNIDLDLQRFVSKLFADSLQGGVVAMVPQTGEVLALYSAPSFDPNRFIGGVSAEYYDSLRTDPRKPLYNKALQGTYPPGSTWKLATSVIALENNAETFNEHMQQPCTGGYYFGNRYWRCWDKNGHGSLNLAGAIAKSCDVYFYQLGLRLQVSRLVAGGVNLGFAQKSGIDLPEERRPSFPPTQHYYDEKYPGGWTQAVSLNLAIGQGENSQTVVNMAHFYSALATDGFGAKPHVARVKAERSKMLNLTQDQMAQLRTALANVAQAGGTAAVAGAALKGVLAGKTGTAQSGTRKNGVELNHAWFVGFAPADSPQIVVAVMLEFGGHGTRAANIASAIIAHYLHSNITSQLQTEG